MSEYLNSKGKRTLVNKFDHKSFDRNVLPGGPISQGYEDYVKSLFKCNNNSEPDLKFNESSFKGFKSNPRNYSSSTTTAHGFNFSGFGTVGEGKPSNISAVTMLRLENQLGKEALNDSNDNKTLQTSLDSIYAELGIDKTIGAPVQKKLFPQYYVYQPKSSTEYQALQGGNYSSYNLPTNKKESYKSYREQSDNEWKKSNIQTLVDYKDFTSLPLSPYLYQHHPYVQRQDSRIIGSNFVQLTTRPRDRFLEKIDQTLAAVRAMPLY